MVVREDRNALCMSDKTGISMNKNGRKKVRKKR